MPTFQPAAGSDDGGDWNNANFSDVGAELTLGKDTAIGYRNFIRFPNITVPAGATITSASIQFEPRWSDSGTVINLDLYFHTADNPAAPTSTSELDTAFASKTSAVAWDNVPAWTANTPNADTTTPSLASILQTIINRGGWASGNAVLLLIDGVRTTATEWRRPKTFDNGDGFPTLTIEYSTGQVARPISDITDGGWTPSAGGSDLFAMVDESSANDSDYMRSGSSPTNDAAEVELGNIDTPDTGTVTLRIRAKLV